MIIEQIALRSFRSAKGLVLDTNAPRVYICGRNGVGKTNVKEALRWALRGVTAETDARGLGWEMLVPQGTSELSAGVKIDKLTVERGYRGKDKELLVNNNPAEISTSQAAVYEALHVDPAFIDAVLETSYFVDLSHAEAKTFVVGLLNVKVPIKDPRLPGGAMDLTLDQVESRYKAEFAKRTQVKADQKAHKVPAFTEPSDGTMPAIQEVVDKIADLRKELAALVASGGNAAGQKLALEQELARAERVQVRIPPEAPADAEIAKMEIAIVEAESALEEAVSKLAAAPPKAKKGADLDLISVDQLQSIATLLTAHKPATGCVIDGNVRCDTPKVNFTNRVKAIKAEIDGRIEPAADEATEVSEDPLTDLRATIEGAKKKHKAATTARDEALAATSANQLRAETVTGIVEKLKALSETPDTSQEAITLLSTRIEKGTIFENRVRTYWNEKAAHTKAVARQKELDEAVAWSEDMVQQLGPKGAMVAALGNAIGAFEERINLTTKVFGWTIRFDMDPWRVWVNQRPLESYSESQRFRIGVAVQLAVSALSGLGFVVVDRIDMLDSEYRNAMTQMLLDAHTVDVQQVIIMATRDDDAPLPKIPSTKAYRLGLNDLQETIVMESLS